MLRSGVGRLSRGAAKSAWLTSDAACSSSYLGSIRPLTSSLTPLRKSRRSASNSALLSIQNAADFLKASFHSDSYFSSSQPEPSSAQSESDSALTSSEQDAVLSSERYLPPLLDIPLIPQSDAQQILFNAILDLDADRSWHIYIQLGKARSALSQAVIDLLITLQCRKPVKSVPGNPIDSRAAVREVCDRVLRLCQDRVRCQVGRSTSTSTSSDRSELAMLSPALSLRLLYLLVVEEEQVAAARSARPPPKRKHLSSILDILSRNTDTHLDIQLRGRLAASLSRLGSTDAAFHHLEALAHEASASQNAVFIDPRPFDQLLLALARQRTSSLQRLEHLPSPIDSRSKLTDENDPLLRALRLTLLSQVPASKANIHRCLQALDSATLWWLLPFELDRGSSTDGMAHPTPDDRFALRSRWHPWQTSTDGRSISPDFLESLAERVALVLAQRGILQPALHIIDGLQPSHGSGSSGKGSHVTTKVPDHDVFTVILEQLAKRMSASLGVDARKSLDAHRGLSLDAHLVMQVYSIAHTVGVDLDPRINEAVIRTFVTCLPTAIVDLGPARAQFSNVKPNVAQKNEARGSRQALQVYLRRFTGMILGKDPDLSKGSLSFPAQATLLGLHMRTRDFDFSRRLYQLLRLREPDREFWSSAPEAGSLKQSALHPLAGPDHDTFMWLFVESLRSLPKSHLAVRLYLDWLASGNTLSSRLTAVFVRALLRAGLTSTVQRVLQELHQDRVFLPARLARSLVASFAEAGFPDLAVQLATNVSQMTAATTPFQSLQKANQDASSYDRESWVLGSTLNLMSIALDRCSNSVGPEDADLHRRVFRLFDEFRLGLTHHLFGAMTRTEPRGDSQLQSLSVADIRKAYNAVMTVRLTSISGAHSSDADSAKSGSVSGWDLIKSTCDHIEDLFNELKDLGADPDDVSWNLRLGAGLHACLKSPSAKERDILLQTLIERFKQSFDDEFRSDGTLQGLLGSRDPAADSKPAGSERPQRVKVQPDIVSSLIDACRQCNDLEAGISVYKMHMRQSGFNVQIEKARLLLLAALAETGRWESEFELLTKRRNFHVEINDRFLEQLQNLARTGRPPTSLGTPS